MSNYNNNRFTPGNKANLRRYIAAQYLRQYYQTFLIGQTFDNVLNSDDITQGSLCTCIPPQANAIKQGYNDPSQTENKRVARILTSTLGGRTTFGNRNGPVFINYLGGVYGQPGGTPKPLRNNF